MNKWYRTIFQFLFWVLIWLLIAFNQENPMSHLKEDAPILLFEIALILLFNFVLIQNFLFQKKYLYFILFGLVAVGLATYFSLDHRNGLFDGSLPPPPNAPNFRKPPPQFLYHSLFLFAAVTIATVAEMSVFSRKKEQDLINSKLEQKEANLQFLKSQINPHFLFNTLNNIYALTSIDTEKTQKSISTLSNILRYVLYDSDHGKVTLKQELETITNYIYLFSLKSSKKYPITIINEVEDENFLIPPMLLIPFVENAFKHSNIEKIEGTFITIKLKTEGKILYFSVENSIPKVEANKADVGGIGIDNVQKRLAILYPEKSELKITTNNNVFCAKLMIENEI